MAGKRIVQVDLNTRQQDKVFRAGLDPG